MLCFFPALQYHYKTLEALALQLDAPEAKDGTFPDVAAISEVSQCMEFDMLNTERH